MGTAVDFGQVRNVIYLQPGAEATWAFAWEIDALQFVDLDAGQVDIRTLNPAGGMVTQGVEIIRTWHAIDDQSRQWRYATFRNVGNEHAYLLPSLVRAPNKW